MATMVATAAFENGTGASTRGERPARFDKEALAQMDALYSFAFKLTRVREEAEDLVSDTMLRAFERWRQFQMGSNIRAWMFTILYHAFVSRRRRIVARELNNTLKTL